MSENIYYTVNLFVFFVILTCECRQGTKSLITPEEKNPKSSIKSFIPYQPVKDSFLIYILNLKQNSTELFTKECSQKRYQFSYFNQLVYAAACNQEHNQQNVICNGNAFQCSVNTLAKQEIKDLKERFDYQERVFEDVPFCTVTVCPYLEVGPLNVSLQELSMLDCMPNWCRVGFYILLITDIILGISIAISNTFVIYVSFKYDFYKCLVGFFAVSLSASNAMTGYLSQPFTVYNLLKQYKFPLKLSFEHAEAYLIATGMIQTISIAVSFFILFGIAISRYIALAYPVFYFKYKLRLIRFIKISIFLSWLFSLFIGFCSVYEIIPGDQFHIHPIGMTLSFQFDALHLYQAIISFIILFLWLIYAFSYRSVIKHAKQSTVPINLNSNSQNILMLRILKLMILDCSICYLPILIIQSFREYPSLQLENYDNFSLLGNSIWNAGMLFSSRLLVLNSLFSCIVFNSNNKHLRKELHNLFQFQGCKSESHIISNGVVTVKPKTNRSTAV